LTIFVPVNQNSSIDRMFVDGVVIVVLEKTNVHDT